MLLVSAIIGVFHWYRGNKTTEDFLLASRSMSTIPMTLSLAASFLSAITLLGTPAEVYTGGTMWMTAVLPFPLVMAIVIHFFIPVYNELNLTTSYEYLQLRFNKTVRLSVSFLFCLQMVLYMAIVCYAPALALIQVTGLLNGIDYDIEITCAIIFAVCIFYSSIGGIKAVIWTDTFQALVMFGAYLGITVYGSELVGGPSRVFDINYQAGRVELVSLDLDVRQRHTSWGLFFGQIVLWTSVYGTNQAMVQRYQTVQTTSQVVTSLWLNCVATQTMVLLCGYAGMVAFAFYQDCDPLKAKQISKKDQIFPYFVMQLVGDFPGLPGLFVAGVLSGALSTVSSGLNSLAAVFLSDFLQLGCQLDLSEQKKTLLTKFLSAGFGLISFAFVFMVGPLPGVLGAALGIFGMVGGPILGNKHTSRPTWLGSFLTAGVFSLGMFVPFSTTAGALLGLVSSLLVVFWAGFGQMVARQEGTYDSARFSPVMSSRVENCTTSWTNITVGAGPANVTADTGFLHLGLYDLSYLWYGPLSFLLCFLLGCLGSLVRPQDHRLVNHRLISPNCSSFFCWTPDFLKKKIHNYYLNVGAELRENLSSDDVFGKNGSVNTAYIPQAHLHSTQM